MLKPRVLMFLPWAYFLLRKIQPEYEQIEKYKREGNDAGIIEESTKVGLFWSHEMMKKLQIDFHMDGLENLPEGSALYVSNHQGYVDILAFLAIPEKQVGFIAKEELGKIPIFGRWISQIGSLFLPRDDLRGSLKVLDQGIEMLKKGYNLVIFPEGTRSKSSKMGAFKRGSLKFGLKAGVPIVPVTVNGTYQVFEETDNIQYGKRVDLYIHPPIDPTALNKEEQKNLAETIEEIIKQKLENLARD